MNLTLTQKMLIILFLSLICIFTSQIAVRTLIELPAHRELEAQSDVRDVERIKMALWDRVRAHENIAFDNAVWDVTYDFIALSPLDSLFGKYILDNFAPETFVSLNVGGVLVLDTMNQPVFSGYYDSMTNKMLPTGHLSFDELDPAVLRQSSGHSFPTTINAGIIDSNIGPVIFAASKILPTNGPYPESRGTFIFWTKLDEKFFSSLSKLLRIDLDIFPVLALDDNPELLQKFNSLSQNIHKPLPRDEQGNLYWNIIDRSEKPLFLVRQKADLRIFDDSRMSRSLIVGFAVSGLILIIISVLFSRHVIHRITIAKWLMNDIINTGNYANRLVVGGKDQIDMMFEQFNQLLHYIQNQEQTLKEQNKSLEKLNKEDALTGISNRRHLDEVLSRSWRQCMRSRQPISALMIDVDCFKAYNDYYGHQFGDHVLRDIAQTLQRNVHRATDHLSRYGGEEFAVILMDTDKNEALSVGKHLCKAIEALQIRHETSICSNNVTVSVGVATMIPDANEDELDLINAADKAMYQAKAIGRNNACCLD